MVSLVREWVFVYFTSILYMGPREAVLSAQRTPDIREPSVLRLNARRALASDENFTVSRSVALDACFSCRGKQASQHPSACFDSGFLPEAKRGVSIETALLTETGTRAGPSVFLANGFPTHHAGHGTVAEGRCLRRRGDVMIFT